MKISGKVTRKNVKAFDKLTRNVEASSFDALVEAVMEVRNEAILMIKDNSDGETVTRYNPTREVKASFPGEPPNADTGRLMQSIDFEIDKRAGIGKVGTNLRYGKHLEYGTENMAARPWLSTALRVASRKFPKLFSDSFRKAIKEST